MVRWTVLPQGTLLGGSLKNLRHSEFLEIKQRRTLDFSLRVRRCFMPRKIQAPSDREKRARYCAPSITAGNTHGSKIKSRQNATNPEGLPRGSLLEKRRFMKKDSYSKLNQPALYSESFSSTVADCCVEERYT